MSTTTCIIQESAAAIQEESHRIASLGPVISQGQLEASCRLIRLALAQLERQAAYLPVEHPKAPLEAFVGEMGVIS